MHSLKNSFITVCVALKLGGRIVEFSYRLCASPIAKGQSVQSVNKILAVTKHLSKSSYNCAEFAGGFFSVGTRNPSRFRGTHVDPATPRMLAALRG